MEVAGVETGAKIFVEPELGTADCDRPGVVPNQRALARKNCCNRFEVFAAEVLIAPFATHRR